MVMSIHNKCAKLTKTRIIKGKCQKLKRRAGMINIRDTIET